MEPKAGAGEPATLNPAHIEPFSRQYLQYSEYSDGTARFNSILTREIRSTSYDGTEAFLIIQRYQMAEVVDYDSSYVSASDLSPLAYYTDIASGGYTESVLFGEDEISNSVHFADSTSEQLHENPAEVFYNGVMQDDLISALPIAEGKTFTIQAINPGRHYWEYSITVTVEGAQHMEIAGLGTVRCWRLDVSSGGGRSSKQWYSVDGQVQVRTEFKTGDGGTFIRTLIMNR